MAGTARPVTAGYTIRSHRFTRWERFALWIDPYLPTTRQIDLTPALRVAQTASRTAN